MPKNENDNTMTYTTEDEIERQVVERMGQTYYNYTEALNELKKLKTGMMVLLPVDMEHAQMMVRVGQHYISEKHKETIRAIKQGT